MKKIAIAALLVASMFLVGCSAAQSSMAQEETSEKTKSEQQEAEDAEAAEEAAEAQAEEEAAAQAEAAGGVGEAEESGFASLFEDKDALDEGALDEEALAEEALEKGENTGTASKYGDGEWAGYWYGGDVEITITQFGDSISMEIVDAEMHTSPDSIQVSGNTIVAKYIITSAMAPEADPATFPEQEWVFTLTKNGNFIDFYRTNTLTWTSVLLDDGTYGSRTLVEENSALLDKAIVTN